MSNSVVSSSFNAFASQDVKLNDDQFRDVLNFFEPKQLAIIESVCTSWKAFIETTGQWKKHCQDRLNIPNTLDPKSFLPEEWNYKKGALLASPKVFDGRMYQYYLDADVGPVPPIPEEISLERADEQDPCNPINTIGRNYTWFFCPKDFTFEDPPFYLYKPDDPTNEEAPWVEQLAEKTGKKRVLTVPNTINNIGEIFKHPKNGNPSAYSHIWVGIAEQHGNKRTLPEWVCMSEDLIGRGLSFPKQQGTANKAGVVISSLLHRIIFNFLKQSSARKANSWPDGENNYARTSPLYRDLYGTQWFSGCGNGGNSGLCVGSGFLFSGSGPHCDVAVVLPTKVQSINS